MKTKFDCYIYWNPNGHITIEKIGQVDYYVVYVNEGVAAVRKHVIATDLTNALPRAISKLGIVKEGK